MKLIDTNIWMHALSKDSPKKQKAQDVTNLLMGLGEAAMSIQNTLELYSAMTKTLSCEEAAYWSDHFLDTVSIRKIEPKIQDAKEAIATAKEKGVKRSEVFDILLAITAKNNGIDTILTENPKHFKDLGLKVETLENVKIEDN
jgi:predicted nucleic acid-binding protein